MRNVIDFSCQFTEYFLIDFKWNKSALRKISVNHYLNSHDKI